MDLGPRFLKLLGLLFLASLIVACGSQRRGDGGSDDDDSSNSAGDDDDGDDDDAGNDDDDAGNDDDDAGNDDDDAGNDDDDVNEDSDGDGLTDNFEGTIGTDPFDVDTDGDGYQDGVEHLSYFFADDASDWPYLGDYPRQAIPGSLASGGTGLGAVPSNFSDQDQHGQALWFHRFYGNVVMVELAAEW